MYSLYNVQVITLNTVQKLQHGPAGQILTRFESAVHSCVLEGNLQKDLSI